MIIENLMTRSVITLPSSASVYEAVKLMNENNIGCLVVVYNDEIVGILTERDLLERVLEKCKDPKEISVSQIMTEHVIVGKPNMELTEATKVMFENGIKKLPIVKEKNLVGIITLTDIARATSTDRETVELIKKLSNMHTL